MAKGFGRGMSGMGGGMNMNMIKQEIGRASCRERV